MASLTIRNIDEPLKRRLRIQAAHNGRSMEEEVRQILRQTLENGVLAAEPPAHVVPLRIAPVTATPASLAPTTPLTLAAPLQLEPAPEPTALNQRAPARVDRPMFATLPASRIDAGPATLASAKPQEVLPAEPLPVEPAPTAARPVETELIGPRLELVEAKPREDRKTAPIDALAAKPGSEPQPTAAPPLSVEAFTDGLRQRLALLVGVEAASGRRT